MVKKVTKFFNWAFTNEGAKKAAEDLGYLPLPAETVEMVNQYWGKYEVSPK